MTLTDRLLTTDHLAERWAVTRRHVVANIITQPGFPPPARYVTSRLRWWSESSIEQWEARGRQATRAEERANA
jgi:predicted DNA-binding transcriptional regulator AlpA